MVQVYYRFELNSSPGDLWKVNRRKTRLLERELEDVGYDILEGKTSIGVNATATSLLVGINLSEKDGKLDLDLPLREIGDIISDLDLPYELMDFYTPR